MRAVSLAFALSLGVVTAGLPQMPKAVKIKEERPGLLKQAKILPANAQQTAQAKYPKGTVKKGEIEKEDGKLVYSFDIQLKDSTGKAMAGMEEVVIDAMDGSFVKTIHESAAYEKKESHKKPAKKPPTK